MQNFFIGLGVGLAAGIALTYFYQYKVITAGKKALAAVEGEYGKIKGRL